MPIQIGPQLGALIGHLWSISVEEQFYLVWAPVIKFGGKRLAFLVSILFVAGAATWLCVFSGKGWTLWFDTPVEFLFFAAGALIALATRGNAPRWMDWAGGALRGLFLVVGPCLLLIASGIGGAGIDRAPGLNIIRLSIGYGGGLAGCSLIFLAMLGMRNIPGPLIYLGKISYGLYVVHLAMLALAVWMLSPLGLAAYSTGRVIAVDGFALLLSICAAHLSYRYFEMSFLKLKERFSVIKSRPA